MVIPNEIMDKAIRTLDRMFDYINNQDVSFLVYMNKDFPLSKVFVKGINELKNYKIPFHFRCVDDIKGYTKDSKMIVFTILINDFGINDVIYKHNDISNLYETKYKKEIFQIFVNCQYTNYRLMMQMFEDAIHRVIEKRFIKL